MATHRVARRGDHAGLVTVPRVARAQGRARSEALGDDIKKPQNDSDSSEYSDDEHAKPSLREEVERKYWPERYKFLPFGDPFVQKRKLRARRARAKTRSFF